MTRADGYQVDPPRGNGCTFHSLAPNQNPQHEMRESSLLVTSCPNNRTQAVACAMMSPLPAILACFRSDGAAGSSRYSALDSRRVNIPPEVGNVSGVSGRRVLV